MIIQPYLGTWTYYTRLSLFIRQTQLAPLALAAALGLFHIIRGEQLLASGHAADSHKHELPPTLTALAVSEADVTWVGLVLGVGEVHQPIMRITPRSPQVGLYYHTSTV